MRPVSLSLLLLQPASRLVGYRWMEPTPSPCQVTPLRLPAEAADKQQDTDHSHERHTYEDDLHQETGYRMEHEAGRGPPLRGSSAYTYPARTTQCWQQSDSPAEPERIAAVSSVRKCPLRARRVPTQQYATGFSPPFPREIPQVHPLEVRSECDLIQVADSPHHGKNGRRSREGGRKSLERGTHGLPRPRDKTTSRWFCPAGDAGTETPKPLRGSLFHSRPDRPGADTRSACATSTGGDTPTRPGSDHWTPRVRCPAVILLAEAACARSKARSVR